MDPNTRSEKARSIVSRRGVMRTIGAALGASAIGGIGAGGGTGGKTDDASEGGSNETGNGSEEDDAEGTNEPIEIAHRGFAGIYPENTIRAMEGAARLGADAIEIDLVPCGDGEIVVFHDDRLSERTDGGLTDAEGVVWETGCETVLDTEVYETGETIPTFQAVMDAIPPEVGVVLEFKNPGSFDIRPNENLEGKALETQKDLWRPFTRDVLDVVSGYDNELLAAASREAAIATVRELDPSVPTAFFFSDSIETGLDVTRTYDCEVIFPPINMIQGTPLFESPDYYVEDPDFADTDLVEVASEEGRELYVFTLTSGYEADQLRAAGVDGILTDYPGLFGYGGEIEIEAAEEPADAVFDQENAADSGSWATGSM